MIPANKLGHLMSLDIGAKRIGVALASYQTLLASPLLTLDNDDRLIARLKEIVADNQVDKLVVGLPRSLDGKDTKQTEAVRKIAKNIEAKLGLNLSFQDEALTSIKAKEELASHGKLYIKSDVDKLAACYILEDYIGENFR